MADTEHGTEDASHKRESSPSNFVNALDFVDAELDAVEFVSDLSVEGLATLAILGVVRSPKEVRVNVTRAQRMVVLEYDVCTEDIGQVIGKGGHTIDAIRSLSKSVAGRADIEYVIYLMEDGKPASGAGGAPRSGQRRGPNRGGHRRRR